MLYGLKKPQKGFSCLKLAFKKRVFTNSFMPGDDIYERVVQAEFAKYPGEGVLERIELQGRALEAIASMVVIAAITVGSAFVFTSTGIFREKILEDSVARLFFGALCAGGIFTFILILNSERHFAYRMRSRVISFAMIVMGFMLAAVVIAILNAALRLGKII
jgi:hypothetical protein